MNSISQTTFSNVFSSMKMFEFRLRFHRSLFPKGRIDNIPALVLIMVWCRWGDTPLSEPMSVSLPMHICVTRPHWVKPQPLLCWRFENQLHQRAWFWHRLTRKCYVDEIFVASCNQSRKRQLLVQPMAIFFRFCVYVIHMYIWWELIHGTEWRKYAFVCKIGHHWFK